MPSIKPGDVFYDKLDDGRYEKCVLKMTTPETPDRHAAARGGTGEFYRVLTMEEVGNIDEKDESIALIMEGSTHGIPCFVTLQKIA